MIYEFTELELNRIEFFNLVFMNEPSWWREDEEHHELLLKICGQRLHKVVMIVKEEAGITGDTFKPDAVFENLQDIKARKRNGDFEDKPWFKTHLDMSKEFDFNIMPPIWIRNLSEGFRDCERKKCPNGSYYMEDGNTRALVHAIRIIGKTVSNFTPFPVIHANSWEPAAGILGHLPQKASILEKNGVFPYKRKFKESVRLPIGIGVDWYKGSSRQNR